MNLTGQLGIDYTEDWSGFWQSVNSSVLGAIGAAILSLPSGIPQEQANITLKETHPQHFSTGISARVLPWLTINTDVDWVDMNSQEFIDIKFDRELEFLNAARILAPEQVTPTSLRLERNKKDVWSLGYGATFHVSSRLDLRAGVQHRTNPIREGGENLSGPIWDANLYGVGLGYEWSRNTHIDMHASWLKSSKTFLRIRAAASTVTILPILWTIPMPGLTFMPKHMRSYWAYPSAAGSDSVRSAVLGASMLLASRIGAVLMALLILAGCARETSPDEAGMRAWVDERGQVRYSPLPDKNPERAEKSPEAQDAARNGERRSRRPIRSITSRIFQRLTKPPRKTRNSITLGVMPKARSITPLTPYPRKRLPG